MHAERTELETSTVCLQNPNPSYRLDGVCGWFGVEFSPQIYRWGRWWRGWPDSSTWLVDSGLPKHGSLARVGGEKWRNRNGSCRRWLRCGRGPPFSFSRRRRMMEEEEDARWLPGCVREEEKKRRREREGWRFQSLARNSPPFLLIPFSFFCSITTVVES